VHSFKFGLQASVVGEEAKVGIGKEMLKDFSGF
jgi:hypothetical protein